MNLSQPPFPGGKGRSSILFLSRRFVGWGFDGWRGTQAVDRSPCAFGVPDAFGDLEAPPGASSWAYSLEGYLQKPEGYGAHFSLDANAE